MSDNFGLSDNAVKIFKDLYSFQEEKIEDTFRRVSKEFATDKEEEKLAYDLLANGTWRPNTPVFLNAGTKHKVFSACYVVGLEDSMNSIYDVADVCRKIFQYGAGVGIPIGNLREKESWIFEGNKEKLPEGKSSGPITFMKLYDAVGETTKSGGRVRRAAILVSMPVWHPDIMDFIRCKEIDGRLSNMNISVLITDKFMRALEDKTPFDLVSPYDGKKISEIDPQEIWDAISQMSWKSADPGVLFIDAMNKYNPLIKEILIEATNPCVTGNTMIKTVEGEIPIRALVGKEIDVYCMRENGELAISEAKNIRKTKKDAELVRIRTTRHNLLCTPDHRIFTRNRGWVEAQYLTLKDKLMGLNKKMVSEQYSGVALTGGKYIREHRFIMAHYENIDEKDVHHKDGDTLNNVKYNLEVKEHGHHSVISNLGHVDWSDRDEAGRFVSKEVKKKKKSLSTGRQVGVNLRILSIERVQHTEDVYDLEVEKYHNFIADGIVIHNCGEQPLQPFNACNLSAINIWKFCRGVGDFDWDGLYEITYKVMGLMDNLIDVMDFPDDDDILDRKRFRTNTLKYRPVGVGPMGLADAMYTLGYRYDGADGRKFASEVMRVMTSACAMRSALLAYEKGSFHNYEIHKEDMERIIEEHTGGDEEVMTAVRKYGVRNCQFTTCQPTGTTALSCDASYGIEPIMGLSFQKNLISGDTMNVVNPVFEQRFSIETWYSPDLPDRIFKNGGSLKGLHNIPKEVKNVFVTAHDIKYKDRIDMQAALQKYCSTAISSTVNLSKETSVGEMADLYEYAYKKGLKGITVYRDGSKSNQPVTFSEEKKKGVFERPKTLDSKTHVVETGNGKMYVTVSHHKGKPLELFIFLGKSGQILNTLSEAMGRVISIGLQQGVPVEEITKTLININSDKMVWYRFEDTDKRPTQILSIPDGVAKLLDRYYTGIRYNGELGGEICEKCGNFMTAMEGCFNCPACGHSKCS